MTNLDKINEEIERKSKLDSDFYTIKEGANKLRILSDFEKVETLWEGQKYKGHVVEGYQPSGEEKIRTQGWAWAIIRGAEGDELKIVQLSKTILGQLTSLKNDPEYTFDEFPTPYDVTITAKGAGTKEVEYTTTASRKNTEVTEAEMEQLNKKKPIQAIIQAIIDKQEGSPKE